jgi:hypothetical protein
VLGDDLEGPTAEVVATFLADHDYIKAVPGLAA